MDPRKILAVFVIICRAMGITSTKEMDECFSWAVGEDWDRIPMSVWRERVSRRIGVELPKDVTLENFIRRVVELWKRRKN